MEKVEGITVQRHGENLFLYKSYYNDNGRIALILLDEHGEPYSTCTINIPEVNLNLDEVIIKDYSENEGMVDCLLESKVIKLTGKVASSGYVICPIAKVLV